MKDKLKAVFLPAKKTQIPREQFERFVSALIQVPKKEVDEKQRELKADCKAEKDSPESV